MHSTMAVFKIMSPLPHIYSFSSIKLEVKKGETYYWCSCGLSSSQPFCDGSHKSTNFTPIQYDSKESKILGFCGCKHTKNPPLCDGSHQGLEK